MMRRRGRMFLSFMLIFSIALGGCYGQKSNSTSATPPPSTKQPSAEGDTDTNAQPDRQVLHLVATNEIPTLKTNGIMDGLSSTIIANLYEGLYRVGPDNKPIPGIAERYDVSDDHKTYTFHLRSANWSNGKPVTADDFVFAWRRAIHPDTISPHAYLMDDIKNSKAIQDKNDPLYGKVDELGVKALDPSTLQVTLQNGVPYFLNLLTNVVYFPQNQEYLQSQGDRYALEAGSLIFNGPFIMESWQHDKSWVLKKNPAYWDAANVKLDSIVFNVVKDVSTAVNLYDTGTLDVADLSSELIDMYSGNPDFSTSLRTEVYFIRMNLKNKILQNANIRKAIDSAWNKQQAAELLLKNGSIPAYFLVPKNFVFSPDDGKDFRDKYGDLNAGGKEAALAFWRKGLQELGTDKLELEFLSYDDEARKKVSEFIKSDLEKALPGLTITINMQPNKQKLALESKQEYALSYSGWRASLEDPVDFLSVFLSDGPYNWQDFNNAEYDRLIRKAMTDFSDPAARFHELQDAENILVGKETVISPMYQSAGARLIKPYVKGFVAYPNATYCYKWTYLEGKPAK